MLRRIELTSGLLAGVVGILAWIYVLSGPLYATVSTSTTASGTRSATTTYGSATLAEVGLSPRALLFLVAMLLCVVGVAVGAYLHGGHGIRSGLALLCVSAAFLLGGALISLLSVGILLAPAALLALIAALAAVVEAGRLR